MHYKLDLSPCLPLKRGGLGMANPHATGKRTNIDHTSLSKTENQV
jgi:hypothetical protein